MTPASELGVLTVLLTIVGSTKSRLPCLGNHSFFAFIAACPFAGIQVTSKAGRFC